AVIPSAIHVGTEVVEPMTIYGDICRRRIEARRLDHRDLAPVADAVRGHVLPCLPAISGEMEQAGVAASPDLIGFQRRRCDAIHNAKASFLRVLHRARSGGLFARGVRHSTGKVGTDLLPVQAAVGSLHHVLRSQIERVLLQRREDEHRRPWIAIFALVDLAPKIRSWPWRDVLAQRGAAVPTHYAAVNTGSINDVRIAGIGGQPSAFASADHKPVARCDQSMIGSARYGCAAAVLLRAVNVIGKLI